MPRVLLSAPSFHSRLVQITFLAVVLIVLWCFILPQSHSFRQRLVPYWSGPAAVAIPSSSTPNTRLPQIKHQNKDHPIDQLIVRANEGFRLLIGKKTENVHDAARAYRARRGREPPPHFDEWFEYASKNKSAIIVEEFFDRIYDDLNPFWGVPPKQIREQANDFLHRISIRDGNVTKRTDVPLEDRPWMLLWSDMVQSVAEFLPDVDLAINVMDESRLVVPWEEINGYMAKAKRARKSVPAAELRNDFSSLKESLKQLDKFPLQEHFDPMFQAEGPFWPLAVAGCPPDSPARSAYIESDFSHPPPLKGDLPNNTYYGYVQNWTYTQSPCDHSALQGLHGSFVEPISISTSKKFFPLFGGSKLPMNNEILLPPAMYWTDDPFYSGGEEHGQPWEEKHDQLIWRGAASGGRNRENNWTRFQRHRFVSMVNATSIKQMELHLPARPPTFVLPANDAYDLTVQKSGAGETPFSEWVATWADAAFVHLLCFPDESPPHCRHTDPYFSVEKGMPMSEQYLNKYLPDIDGNSFSGRYRGFLGSTSMPIKATIYQEWHDSRLVPWKHFVPMDNTFIDIYGIMQYFVGNSIEGLDGHDEEAKSIALEGKAWAEKVLRKEDMSIYVYRLILEYARLCDDERDRLSWVEKFEGGLEGAERPLE
ncbi:glycosyltransferase family 90 [Lecanosticta acicola]|uniref:Glycosyltransferase family 90 n=1 Tax=Lecanosticta acicola TaxID=111012 RepID=A0AAI8Z0N8_9PEZI|nr:glycosyltransferase family 90 [Lecanosticta acicola]